MPKNVCEKVGQASCLSSQVAERGKHSGLRLDDRRQAYPTQTTSQTRSKRRLPLTLLIALVVVVLCGGQAAADQLAELKNQAGSTPFQDTADFKIPEQTSVQVSYDVTAADTGCSLQIRVYREQNGRWLVVSNVLRTSDSCKGAKPLRLSPGNYRITVTAKHAKYHVTISTQEG